MASATNFLPGSEKFIAIAAAVTAIVLVFVSLNIFTFLRIKRTPVVLRPPSIPGWPVVGNALQLKKKPHEIFTRWAELYGPIFSIRIGCSRVVVLNSMEIAKEAMIARFSSISTRKLPWALNVLTENKSIVAISDYNEFYMMMKHYLVTNLLGRNAQKESGCHKKAMLDDMSNQLHVHVNGYPLKALNLREILEPLLSGLTMRKVFGMNVQSLYIDELGTTLSREKIHEVLVHDPIKAVIQMDWRDYFPYLKWFPNRRFETKIQEIHICKQAVMKALIALHKKEVSREVDCYLNFLLSEGKTLSEKQISMLLWEVIIESSDTTIATIEWAIHELAKNPDLQERLHDEIEKVCGNIKMEEEYLIKIPYLGAVFQETLRRHSPIKIVPLRYVLEDTRLGGYCISAGSEIAVNIHGCNMDKKQWENPEEWKPDRFLQKSSSSISLYKTMAFGAGKRACPGALQATLIGCMAIGRLVQEFEVRTTDGKEDDINPHSLVACRLNPLLVTLKPRSCI